MPESTAREPLPRIFHFRLSESDGEIWDDKIARSGLKISEFMREAVIRNQTVVVGDASSKKRPVRKKVDVNPDVQKTIFLLAAVSRNVNQIARRLNTDNLAGLVTPATYAAVLDELLDISAAIKRA